jgi:ElaB/YqjD/DUF883 family membrane-anchored ribosome-binding protein
MANVQRPIENLGRGNQTQTGSQGSSLTQGVKDQTKEIMDSAGEMAGQARDKVQQFANQAKDFAQEYGSVAFDKAEDIGKELTSMIRRYPLQALLVGLGIGMLLGRVSRS